MHRIVISLIKIFLFMPKGTRKYMAIKFLVYQHFTAVSPIVICFVIAAKTTKYFDADAAGGNNNMFYPQGILLSKKERLSVIW